MCRNTWLSAVTDGGVGPKREESEDGGYQKGKSLGIGGINDSIERSPCIQRAVVRSKAIGYQSTGGKDSSIHMLGIRMETLRTATAETSIEQRRTG